MDEFDEVRKNLEEKGYHVGPSGYVFVNGEAFQQPHTITSEEVTLLGCALNRMCEKVFEFSAEMISTVNEVLPEIMQRTPEEIKRDIKYEKNPMRLKQLNRELNASYKFWRKRK